MKLPNNEIGVSDIKQFRDCPRRFLFGMRRHTEGAEPPEDQHPATVYGTVIHEAFTLIEEEGLTDDEAIQRSFDFFAPFLDPEDLDKIKADFETYHERAEPLGYRTVANETEARVPLFEHPEHGMIYFRAKLDRLYQRRDSEEVFLHRDFKSSKWQKSEEDVHNDLQMWAYNWLIHEQWPECEHLTQVYDQLRYGEESTRKSAEQRDQMKEWLIRQVTAILNAPEEPEPKLNEWCPWCPIKESCSVVHRLGEYQTARLAALLPEGEKPDLDRMEEYVERLPEMETAVKTLEAYIKSVKGTLKELPGERREALGYYLSPRNSTVFDPEALKTAKEIMGEEFWKRAKLSQKGVKDALPGEDFESEREAVMDLARQVAGTPVLKRRR